MNKDKLVPSAAIWLVLINAAIAHPPYVETWMHTANLSVSGIVGIFSGIVVQKKLGIFGSLIVGLCVFLICGLCGWFLSIIGSM